MKIVVFSDTHLEKEFNIKKFNFLKRIIEKADRVIINGDFWEGYTNTFKEFIDSPWNKLFPILKKKKTVCVFGNHDRKKYSDKNVSLFCDKAVNKYSLIINKKAYDFEHGSQWADFVDRFFGGETPSWFVKIYNKVVNIFVMIFRKRFLLLYKIVNDKAKKKALNKSNKNSFLVYGHTHYGEVDLKNNIANTGLIKYGFGQYLLMENSKISLHEEWY
jgi:predicted phosphodiesterase